MFQQDVPRQALHLAETVLQMALRVREDVVLALRAEAMPFTEKSAAVSQPANLYLRLLFVLVGKIGKNPIA